MFDPSAQFELAVCPLGRRPADEYYHQGQVWIEGREGNTYTLRFTNRTNGRVFVVFSVDGLDVLKGQPAGHLSEGYVVNAGSTLDVPGWKLNNTTAAEFFFSRSDKSYVAKIGGNVNNTGVIGAMVFKEYQQPYAFPNAFPTYSYNGQPTTGNPVPRSIYSVSANSIQASAVSASIGLNSVGTGYGNATEWNTTTTTFVKENPTVPNAIMAVYYDSRKNLERRGIVMKSRYNNVSNSAFPAYVTGATPPPDWKP